MSNFWFEDNPFLSKSLSNKFRRRQQIPHIKKMRNIFRSLDTPAGKLFHYLSILIAITLIVTFVFETTLTAKDSNSEFYYNILRFIDYGLVAFLLCEYFIRLYISRNPLFYPLRPFALLDMVIIVAFLFGLNINFLRIFWVLKVIQGTGLVKFSGLIRSSRLMFKTYINEIKAFFVYFSFVVFLSASTMYFLERDHIKVDEGKDVSEFATMLDSLWWTIVTIFTVGFGDITPGTPMGKFAAAIIIFFGITVIAIMTALTTKILVDSIAHRKDPSDDFTKSDRFFEDFFVDEIDPEEAPSSTSEKKKMCPHCGKDINEKKSILE